MIQILPFTAEDHAGVEGPITVYDLNENRSVGYAECYDGGRMIEADDEVADLLTTVNLLRASSLPVRESAALMREIRSEMR
ncbi:MAG TPA: Scr1 family TA system antitoxin-like transcriptional regulator [Streptosporangiaceae bacterium]